MKNILIVATQTARFLDQLNLAEEISNKNDNNITIFFFIGEDIYEKYNSIIDNFSYFIINSLSQKTQLEKKIYNHRIKEILRKYLSIYQIEKIKKVINKFKNTKLFTKRYKIQEIKYLNDLEKKYVSISRLIINKKIDVMLINGDRHLGYEPVFLKISKELNIPSIIVFLVDYADEERIFHNDVITKKIKTNFFTSRYIIDSQNKLKYKVLRDSYYYPHPIGNSLQKFGTITSNPYVMGSGVSNILCLNNKYYKDLYIKNGVNKNKIKLVGDGSYDKLYQKYIQKDKIKKELLKKYKLDKYKQIIIIALPQLGEHNILPWDKHWEEINFLMSNLDSLNQNILISLHPKMDRKKYDFLENKYTCKILDERLSETLVATDMFIATFSSTVVWAILCGIKTLVVDFYGLNYTMYDFLTSIKKVNDKKLLEQNLKEMLNGSVSFAQDWKNLSKDEVFDGKTTQRYVDLIGEISKS